MKYLSLNTVVRLAVLCGAVALAGSATAQVDTAQAKEAYNEGIKASQAGKLDEAALQYRAAIKYNPDYADAHLNLGAVLFERKEYDQALESFEKAVSLSPKNVDALANLGRVEYVLKRYDAAAQAFQKAIEIDPKNADLYKELGKTYYYQNDYANTLQTLDKYHGLGGSDWQTHYMVGKSYEKTNREDLAIDALKKSTAVENNYYAQFTLGQILMGQEKYAQAASAFKAALAADKSKYLASYNYASAMEYSDPENYQKNVGIWEDFVRLAKNNPKAKRQVAQAQEHIKQLREALEAANLQTNN